MSERRELSSGEEGRRPARRWPAPRHRGHLRGELLRGRLGDSALALVTWQFHTVNGDQLARVSVEPANHPVHERKGDQQIFWHRTPTSTIAVSDPQEQDRIIARRWPA